MGSLGSLFSVAQMTHESPAGSWVIWVICFSVTQMTQMTYCTRRLREIGKSRDKGKPA